MLRCTDGAWSVITAVPPGCRQFIYIVDGEPTLSKRHPANSTYTYNWRNISGPPPLQQQSRSTSSLLTIGDTLAERFRFFVLTLINPAALHPNSHPKNSLTPSFSFSTISSFRYFRGRIQTQQQQPLDVESSPVVKNAPQITTTSQYCTYPRPRRRLDLLTPCKIIVVTFALYAFVLSLFKLRHFAS